MHDNPWLKLPHGQAGNFVALRASEASPLDVYWARNHEGRYIFLVKMKSAAVEFERLPRLRGIEIQWISSEKLLQLVLGSAGDWEMFHVLCLDLLESTRSSQSEEEAVHTVVTRLVRWQRLLSKGGPRVLGEREIRGLIGELLFLREDLFPRFGKLAAASWIGPDGHPQDFAIGGVIVEVKTHSAGDTPFVMISSPDQLWSEHVPLYLHVISLAPDSSGAVCLPELVEELTRRLESDPPLLDQFEGRLEKLGYINLPEYRERRFAVTSCSNYFVGSGFPMLIPSVIPVGVDDVKYSIRLDAIERFRAAISWSSHGGNGL